MLVLVVIVCGDFEFIHLRTAFKHRLCALPLILTKDCFDGSFSELHRIGKSKQIVCRLN